MRFSDLRTEILNNAHHHYPELTFKDFNNQENYLACGSTSGLNHINLTLMCTLPLFKDLGTANSQLLEHFGWERRFENYNLKDELKTSQQALHFFSRMTKFHPSIKAQAFIFRPEQLKRVTEIVQKVLPEKTEREIVEDILKNPRSNARKILFDLTEKKLHQERDLLTTNNWKEAKTAFCHFHFFKFFRLLWQNKVISSDTKQLIQNLKRIENKFSGVRIGETYCGDDVISPRCQLESEVEE